MQTQLGAVSISGDKGYSPLPGIRRGEHLYRRGEHLYKGYICSALRRTGKAESASCICLFSIVFNSK